MKKVISRRLIDLALAVSLLDAEKERQEKNIPKCTCCGTTENLHIDRGSGGPYRCGSPDCMVF